MPEYPYLVKPQEPAVFVELYLPRKAVFQGVLYNALTSGFLLENVKSHFLKNDPIRQRHIRSLLGKSWTMADYTPQDIQRFRRVFFGYSLYDVNGVFLKSPDRASGAPRADDDSHYQIAEETTQVVRMVFKYPCAIESPMAIDFLMLALRRPLSDMSQFTQSHCEEIQATAGADAEHIFELLADLEEWLKYVGLFVFGFLIYHICEGILNVGESAKKQIDPADLLQDEIWVTTSWSTSMNVVDWVHRTSH